MQDCVANPTLLHFAARYNLVKLAVAILSCPGGYGALNMQNIDQLTPSQIAYECGHETLAFVLVSYTLIDLLAVTEEPRSSNILYIVTGWFCLSRP